MRKRRLAKVPMDDLNMAAPYQAYFQNNVPSEGFQVVRNGEVLPGAICSEAFSRFFRGGIKGTPPQWRLIAKPREGEAGEELLLPRGANYEAAIPFFVSVPANVESEQEEKTIKNGPPLFDVFANLDTDPSNSSDIVAFANKYGNLAPTKNSLIADEKQMLLETVDFWRRQIDTMRSFLNLPDRVKTLHNYSSWNEQELHEVTTATMRPYGIEQFLFFFGGKRLIVKRKKDARTTLATCLIKFLNQQLEAFPSTPGYGFITSGEIVPILSPTSLLAALWLSLAQSAMGNAPIESLSKPCFVCHHWGHVQEMSVRREGEHAGEYYHKGCKSILDQREHRKRKYLREGRVVRPKKKKDLAEW